MHDVLLPEVKNNVHIKAIRRKSGEEELITDLEFTHELYNEIIKEEIIMSNVEGKNIRLGEYEAGLSFTKNMGNYESMKVDIHVRLPIIIDMDDVEQSTKESCSKAQAIINNIYEENSAELVLNMNTIFKAT